MHLRVTLALSVLVSLLAPAVTFGAAASDAATVDVSLTGVVRDHDGAPLPDALVRLAGGSGSAVAETRSGDSGRYSIDVAPGTYDLAATAERHGRAYVGHLASVPVTVDQVLDIVLIRPGVAADANAVVFTGTVRDGDGDPLPGGVALFGARRSETPIAADGTFRLAVPADVYRLEVSVSEVRTRATMVIEEFVLEDSRHEDIVVPLGEVTVSVTDEQGDPVPGGFIELRTFGDACYHCPAGFELLPGERTDARFDATANPDAAGHAFFLSLPGTARLTVNPPSYAFSGVDREITIPAGGLDVDVQLPEATPVPPVPTVTWRGELDVPGNNIEVDLTQDGRHIHGIEVDGDDEFEITVPAGRYDLEIVLTPDGATRPGVKVRGTSGGDDGTAPVQLFPGGWAHGRLQNNPATDQTGVARLLIFPGAAPPVVTAGLYDVIGEATPAPDDTSAIIRTDSPVLAGDLRDPRGPLPAPSLDDAWVAFRGGPASGQFAPWPYSVGADAGYQLQDSAGPHTLYVSNREVRDRDEDRLGSATLPASWEFVTDYDLRHDTTLDLTIPDASPASVRVAGRDGRPFDGTFSYSATTVRAVELAPDLGFESSVWDQAARDGGSFRPLLLAASKVSGNISRPGFSVLIEGLPLGPGSAAAVLLAHWVDSPPPPTPDPEPTTTTTRPGQEPVTTEPAGTGTDVDPDPKTPAVSRTGYWLLGADATVYAFGDAATLHGPQQTGGAPAVDLESTPSGAGYWILHTSGRITPAGDAVELGELGSAGLRASEQAASLSATPTGRGYWIFTNLGRVLPFGDARSFGDMSDTPLNAPVLDSVATPSGLGYYMVAADGGIFTFGDAVFAGSTGSLRLNAPVQSLVPDGDGAGYWLVASDGGVFAFDAPFRGSMGGTRLNKPVTGMVPYGDGYLMVAEDGGIFTFSDLPFSGSLGSRPPASPVVSVTALAPGRR